MFSGDPPTIGSMVVPVTRKKRVLTILTLPPVATAAITATLDKVLLLPLTASL